MKRRTFLLAATATPLASALPRLAIAQHLPFEPRQGPWKTYEIVTHVEVLKPMGRTQAWIPLPSVNSDYQKIEGDTWTGNAASASIASDGTYGARMLHAEWAQGEANPVIEVTSRFQTRDRALDLSKPDPRLV